MRRLLLVAASVSLAITLVPTPASGGGGGGGGGGGTGGPIILMGIDADDGGHGDDSIYIGLMQSLNDDVNKSGSGIAVVGAGGGAEDWWTDITTGAGLSPTFVDGGPAISSFNFSPFRIIGVAGTEPETGGGLSQEEHDALSARSGDIQSFVRGGGGIFGLSSTFDPSVGAGPYAWITGAAAVTSEEHEYSDVTSTPDGQAVGINDTNLDVCCWHNTFTQFPSFLKVLAVNNGGEGDDTGIGQAAALGGERVLGGECPGVKNLEGNHIVGGQKKDNLKGTEARDIICGLGGNDTLRGLFGNDVILGGDGDDLLLGGHGNDKLKGEDGDDELRGMVGNDDHNGGPGVDRCKGGRGKDTKEACE
jgi:Ca2+-binding RTX toxin-like protein